MIPSFWAWGVASSEHEEALQQALNETGREGEEEAVKEELWNKWKEAEAEEKYPSRAGERPDIIEKSEKQVGALWGISFLSVSWLVGCCGSQRPRSIWRGTTGTLTTGGLMLATVPRVIDHGQRFGSNQRSIGFLTPYALNGMSTRWPAPIDW
jgi:hypothetical protein